MPRLGGSKSQAMIVSREEFPLTSSESRSNSGGRGNRPRYHSLPLGKSDGDGEGDSLVDSGASDDIVPSAAPAGMNSPAGAPPPRSPRLIPPPIPPAPAREAHRRGGSNARRGCCRPTTAESPPQHVRPPPPPKLDALLRRRTRPATARRLRNIDTGAFLVSGRFMPDGRSFITSGADKVVNLFDMNSCSSWTIVRRLNDAIDVAAVAFDPMQPDGALLAVADRSGRLCMYDLGKLHDSALARPAPPGAVEERSVTSEHRAQWHMTDELSALLWDSHDDANDGANEWPDELKLTPGQGSGVTFSADGSMIAAVNRRYKTVQIHETRKGNLVAAVQSIEVGGFWGEPWSVAALSFAHDRLMIVEKAGVAMDVSARSDGRVRVFDLLDQPELFHDAVEAGGRHVANRVTELDPIVVPKPPTALVVSPTVEQSVVVGSADGAVWMVRRHSTAKGRRARIEVGDLETSEMLRLRRSRNGGAVTRLAYSRDGKRLAAGWEMGEFLVFDTDAMVPVASFSVADQYGGHVVDFAPVGDVIALGGGREGHAAFYDLEVGTVVSKPWNLVPPRHYRCEPPMERWLRELERYRVGPLNNETADDDTVMSKCFAICRNDESVPSHRQVSTMDGIREHMRDAGSWIRIKEGIYDVKTAASQHLLLRQLSGSAILDGKGVDATHYLETLGLQGQLSAACTSHTLVALAYGATVEMQERITGKRLWVHTFDDLVEAFSVPMAIRPGVDKGAGQIACVLGKQGGQVAVLDRRRGQRTKAIHAEYESAQIGTAHEVYRTAAHDGHVCEVTYSPDGKWLLVCGAFGVCVYCADTGALHPEMTPEPAVEPRGRRRSVTMAYIQGHGQGRTNSCAMSPDGKWIATVGREGAAQVREVQSGQPVHGAAIATTGSTHSVSFSSNGKSLVYWLCADRHNDPGQVVIADTSTWNEQRFSVKNWKEARVEFSPLEQYLLVVNRDGHFAILDRKGHELPWSDIVRPLLLPFGRVVANSVHWISTCEGTAETSWSRVRSMDSRLQAVVGNQLLVIDLGDAIEASDNDCGCTCTVEQLVNLTANEPSLIQRLTASNPHLVNVRDRQSGDTVLHYCAKNELVDEVTSWLSQPLSAFTPVKNKIDITAAHIAVDTQNRRLLLQLMNSLDSNSMNHVTSEHVCAVLRAVAIKMPEAVRQCLECVQTRLLVQKKDIFRATFPRGAEVLAFDSVTGEESVVRYDDRLGQFQGKWQQTLSRTSDDVAAVRKVLLVREFVGRAGVSPFHEIVNRCDSSVFYCQIMALAVQYKWEAEIYPQVKVEIVVYVVHMLLASTAMTVATKFNQFPVLVPLMVGAVVCECVFVVRLVTKLSTMYRARSEEDSLNQRRSGIHLLEWESLDCVGTICFTLGAFGFFVQTPHLLRAAGSFGVFCKWLRVFGYMRAWAFTGSLVRMIVVIAWDILPFLTILLFLMVGFAIFFVINLPETGVAPANPFGYNPQVLGPLWPPYTVFGMALGSVDIEDHLSSWSAITMHMFLRLFVTILLLNLLIAIMQDSYRRVEEHEVVAGLHEKAKMIRTFELRKPTRKCALYMHIVEPVEVAVTSTNNNTVALDKRMQDIEEQQCAISEHLKKISEQLKHTLAS